MWTNREKVDSTILEYVEWEARFSLQIQGIWWILSFPFSEATGPL